MEVFDKDFLKKHYNKILTNNMDALLAGGRRDPFLADAKNDNRMSLALLIRIPGDISRCILEAENEIRQFEPELYFYPEKDMHITVMDILRGEEDRKIPENLDEYIACIGECVGRITPFSITINGLTASDIAVMTCGFYDRQLQDLRMDLRNSFVSHELRLEERYETVSSHITIARNREGLSDPEKLLEYVKRDRNFGYMKVDSVELSFHNWYDTKKEILHIFKL